MSDIEAINIPKWGMTMTEGTITGWLVEEGRPVTKGDEILEIETTKVTNALESSGTGVLRRIVLPAGTTAPVGALAGVIADKSVPESEIDAFIKSYADKMMKAQAEGDESPRPRLVAVGGTAINVLSMGPEDGDTVVFLHGFGGDLSSWMFNQSVVAERARTLAIDLPGHGSSSLPIGAPAVRDMAMPIRETIERECSGHIHLVGHSFGGALATVLARQLGERVRSLTLLAPIGLGKDINRQFLLEFTSANRRRPLLGALEKLFSDPTKITTDMVEATLSYKRLEGVSEVLGGMASSIADESGQLHDIRSQLAELTCPVTIIWGDEDAIIPVPKAEDVPTNSVLEVVRGVGHMPQMESASSVNEAIFKAIAGP